MAPINFVVSRVLPLTATTCLVAITHVKARQLRHPCNKKNNYDDNSNLRGWYGFVPCGSVGK